MKSLTFQSGMSLIELMVALLIGSVLIAGASKILVSNMQSFRLQDNVSSAQEAGRLGLEILLTDLRRAGLDNPVMTVGGVAMNVGITGRNGSATTGTGTGAVPGLLAASDEVTVAYAAPVDMTNCEGATALAGQVIVNRYYIAVDANPAIPALFCAGTVNTGLAPTTAGAALIRGVESFQVLYGVGKGYTGGTAAGKPLVKGNGYVNAVRYVTAGGIGDIDGSGAVGQNDTVLASSVRVALVVRSESGIQGVPAPANNIAVLDTTLSAADLAGVRVNNAFPVHRLFTGTAALRNSVLGSL